MKRYEEWIARAKSSLEVSKIAVNDNVYYEGLCYQISAHKNKNRFIELIYPLIPKNCKYLFDGICIQK